MFLIGSLTGAVVFFLPLWIASLRRQVAEARQEQRRLTTLAAALKRERVANAASEMNAAAMERLAAVADERYRELVELAGKVDYFASFAGREFAKRRPMERRELVERN